MSLNRRVLITGSAAAMAAPALLRSASQAEAQTVVPPMDQAPAFYRYKVGDITVTAINDGYGERPLEGFIRNADLADVKKVAEEAFFPKDKVRISFTTLAFQTGGKTVLIDTGNGDSGAPTTGQWMRNFKAAGFDPAKVDTVIISHFHGDHINGLRLKDGTAVFPNAEILVGGTEWDFWMDDTKMNAAPDAMKGAFQNVRRVFAPVAKDVKKYNAGQEVAKGITAVPTYGHTPGHMSFAIASGNDTLMVMSDVTNHPALFVKKPDWSAIFDMDADAARATRRKVLDQVAADKMQVAFYHAPFPATGFIVRDGNGFELVPVQWS